MAPTRTKLAISNEHHVARHCRDDQCPQGQVQATAFLRRSIEPGISVNWLEHPSLPTERDGALRKVVEILKNKRVPVKPNSWLAVLAVGRTLSKVQLDTPTQVNLSVSHTPTRKDPCHATMVGMEVADMLVGELLAEIAREAGLRSVRTLVDVT